MPLSSLCEERGGSVNTYLSSSNRPSKTSVFKLVAIFLLRGLCAATRAPAAWSQTRGGSPSSVSTEGGDTSSAGMQVAAGACTLVDFPLEADLAICAGAVGG